MPNPISGLPAVTTLDPAADVFPVVQGGTTKKSLVNKLGIVAISAGNISVAGPNAAAATYTLLSTQHATKGTVRFGAGGTTVYDETNDRIGSGTSTPSYGIHAASGTVQLGVVHASEAIARFRASGAGGREFDIISGATASGLGVGLHIYDRTGTANRLSLNASGQFHITSGSLSLANGSAGNSCFIYLGSSASPTTTRLEKTSTNESLSLFFNSAGTVARFRHHADGEFAFRTRSGDPPGESDFVHIYSKDVAASAEAFVRDEAGNVTQLSPHDPKTGEWYFYDYSAKHKRWRKVWMERLVAAVEEATGQSFTEWEDE